MKAILADVPEDPAALKARTLPRGLPGAPGEGSRHCRERIQKTPPKRVTSADAEICFAIDLAAAKPVSARRIKTELHAGWPRAQELRDHLKTMLAMPDN